MGRTNVRLDSKLFNDIVKVQSEMVRLACEKIDCPG